MTSSQPESQQPFPPLAISDLVVLTLCVAFALACVAPEFHTAINTPGYDLQSIVADLIDELVIGLMLFGLIVVVRQKIRGEKCPLSPGKWILRLIGPYEVLMLAATLLRPIAIAYLFGNTRAFRALDDLLFAVVIGLSVGWSVGGLRLVEVRWRLCLAAVVIWLSLAVVYELLDAAYELRGIRFLGSTRRHFTGVMFTASMLAGCTAVVAAAIDAYQRTRRDWLHHLAVAALVLNSISHGLSWGKTVANWWWDLYQHLIP